MSNSEDDPDFTIEVEEENYDSSDSEPIYGITQRSKKVIQTTKIAPIFCLNTDPSTSNLSAPSTSSTNPDHQADQPSKNPLWKYYTKNLAEATCKTCNKKLKMGISGTTSSLLKHLKLHKPIFEKYTTEKNQFQEIAKRKLEIPGSQSSQPKVAEMFRVAKWPLDSRDQQKTNNLVSRFVVEGLHPYSIVEEPAFKNLLSAGFPRYSVPCRTTLSRSIIPRMYSQEKSKLKSILCNDLPDLESISFTTDGWKSRSGDPYLTSHLPLD